MSINRVSSSICFLAILSVTSDYLFAADVVRSSSSSIPGSQIITLFFGLVFVLVIFLLIAFLLKRFTGIKGINHGHMQIVDAMHLGAKEKLLIVKVVDTHLLIGVSPQGIHKLQELDASLKLQEKEEVESSFLNILSNMKYKRA